MKSLLVCTILLLCISCTSYQGKFSIISTKPVDFKKTYMKIEPPAMGKDERYAITIFTIGTFRLDKAVENALSNENATYLTDAEVKTKGWVIPLIYSDERLEVTGNAWRETKDSEMKENK